MVARHLVAESCTFAAVLAPGGQSGNFWIHPPIPKFSGTRFSLRRTRNSPLL